jgi:hypothetical protein
MKNKLVIFIVLCLFLMLPSTILASELNTGDFELITETKNGQTYTYREPANLSETSYTAQTMDTSNQISVFLENIFNVSQYAVRISYRQEYSTDYYYRSYWDASIVAEETETGTRITITNLDWNTAATYYIGIESGSAFFVEDVTQNDVGSEIMLATDDTFVPVQVEIPFAPTNVNYHSINVHRLDENGKAIVGAHGYPGYYVPTGNYGIQVNATDGTNGYALFKKNVVIDSNSNTISFAQDETSNVSIDLTNNSSENVNIHEFVPYTWDGLTYISHLSLTGQQSIIVSKMVYEGADVSLKTDSNVYYYLGKYGTFDANNDQTIQVDTNLTSALHLQKTTFNAGETVYLYPEIMDSYGNTLSYIRDGTNHKSIKGTVELTNSDDPNEIYSYETQWLDYAEITLPSTQGTFELTYKVEDGPLIITPATATINIGTAGSGGEIIATDLYLNKTAIEMTTTDIPTAVTRAQLSRFLVESFGLYDPNAVSDFSDVPSTHAYYHDISSAVQAGLLMGNSDGTFHPDAPVTRAEYAVILLRALEYPVMEGTISDVSDIQDHWAEDAIVTALHSGLMTLYSDGTFRPSELMNLDTNAQLIAQITPVDATNKHLIWSSSNPEVAIVDATGHVQGIAEGQATITVKTEDGSIVRSAVVTVTDGVFTPDLNGDGYVDIFDIVKAAKQNPAVLKEILNHLRN